MEQVKTQKITILNVYFQICTLICNRHRQDISTLSALKQ